MPRHSPWVMSIKHPLTLLRGAVDKGLVSSVYALVNDLVTNRDPKLLYHTEDVEGKIKTTRIEKIVDLGKPCVDKLFEQVHDVVEREQEDKFTLLKEKVNFKHKGGGTYLAHQDTPAFRPWGSQHVSVLIPFTEYTKESGGLEIATNPWDFTNKAVPMDELAELSYCVVQAEPGDLLLFDGWVPHRSGPNLLGVPRVGWYITFGLDNELGPEAREEYYNEKAKGIDGMSLNQKDYTGRLIPPYNPRFAEEEEVCLLAPGIVGYAS